MFCEYTRTDARDLRDGVRFLVIVITVKQFKVFIFFFVFSDDSGSRWPQENVTPVRRESQAIIWRIFFWFSYTVTLFSRVRWTG